jgi:lysine-specific permease
MVIISVITRRNYFLSWAVSLPIEISAISLILQFWFPGVPEWVWCAVVLSLIFGMNLLGVEGFGETEYWFSLTKV